MAKIRKHKTKHTTQKYTRQPLLNEYWPAFGFHFLLNRKFHTILNRRNIIRFAFHSHLHFLCGVYSIQANRTEMNTVFADWTWNEFSFRTTIFKQSLLINWVVSLNEINALFSISTNSKGSVCHQNSKTVFGNFSMASTMRHIKLFSLIQPFVHSFISAEFYVSIKVSHDFFFVSFISQTIACLKIVWYILRPNK